MSRSPLRKHAGGQVLGENRQRIGLRTLELLPQNGDHPIQLAVNGVPFFAKGANWIPSDVFPTRVTPASLRRYVADAAAVNMNTLRLWGGGYYEEEALYDACDEMGIVVWFDLKFANHAYPTFDPHFMDNVRAEVSDNVRRLRHHPSIAIWCGNIALLREVASWPCQSDERGHDRSCPYGASGTVAMMQLL